MLEKNDNFKQRRINDMFTASSKVTPLQSININTEVLDIEDFGAKLSNELKKPIVTVTKRKRRQDTANEFKDVDLTKSWKEILGTAPPFGTTKVNILYNLFLFDGPPINKFDIFT